MPAPPPLLTVIVPVYNEQHTIDGLLHRLVNGPDPDRQVVVVDDGSHDGTAAALARWQDTPGVEVLRHDRNRGKGAAVRTGLAAARGTFAVIQDADLEYDPADLPRLIEPLRRGEADVVYGSRYLAPGTPLPRTRFRLAVNLLNGLVWLLYGRRLTDEATCYKAMPTALWRSLDLRAERFELCPEVTAKVCRLGLRLVEVPVSYHPRSLKDGKKIGWRDAWPTVWALLKWRVLPVAPAHGTHRSSRAGRATPPTHSALLRSGGVAD
jgi:glycosyltransferase involved in cell wall biosynthesis